jgi:WD40-like Beta Propeller Repeat
VRAGGTDASTTDVVPKPFNVRTRVHEYGGGAWTVALGVVYFSNFVDGRLYRLGPGESEPAPLTPTPLTRDCHWRYADGIIDHGRHRWIGVREDHTDAGQIVNAIVAVDLAQPGTAPGYIIAGGHDFFASPRLSPDGRCLAWLAWDHPNMPWNGTILYVATLDANGAIIGAARRIAGGPAESIFQPEWSPEGTDLVFVSDRSGWWNLYRFTLASGEVRPIAPRPAEFGQPQWSFGMSPASSSEPGCTMRSRILSSR